MRKHGTQMCNFFLIRFFWLDAEERFVLLLVYFGAQLKKILSKACLNTARRVVVSLLHAPIA